MKTQSPIPVERIQRAICLVRGEKVMLDADLAALCEMTTGNLNKAVRRNLQQFPADFMFQLTAGETENLRCQIGISSWYGGRRYLPYAFSEQGVAMLSRGKPGSNLGAQQTGVALFLRARSGATRRVDNFGLALDPELTLIHPHMVWLLRKIERLQCGVQGDIKRLLKSEIMYRLRMGYCRLLFDVEGGIIVIRRIGHRKDVYD